jgi:hypothetical protein
MKASDLSSLGNAHTAFYLKFVFVHYVQDAAEITPTFQRGITNKWYEISPKTFHFPNVDITKYFYFRFSILYHPNSGRDGRHTFGTVLLECPPLVGPRTEDDV